MQVTVTGKQIDVGDSLRRHIEVTTTAIVDKYFDKAIEAHAVFSREGTQVWRDEAVAFFDRYLKSGG